MTESEDELRAIRWRRMRRVKRWLRPLPRRSNIHRYPIIKFFAETAKKRLYIWSFREEYAVPAIYAGCILTLMPLYGLQLIIGFLIALFLRANLPILIGLQIVSNPITAIPIWVADYRVGRIVLGLIGIESTALQRGEIQMTLIHFITGNWSENFERMVSVFGITSLGAIVMGLFFGLVGSVAYRIVARRTAASYQLLAEKIRRAKENKHRES
ncbi:MAG: DUF2062 domain-containing protein [Opitutales bacterium]